MKNHVTTVLLVASLVLVAGCATQGPGPSALCNLKDDNGNLIPPTFTGTLNPRHQGHAATHVVLLQKVETACCNGYDRTIFTFEGFHHPTWRTRYVLAPIQQCASGNNIAVAGTAFLQISMDTAQAHNDAGQSTIPDRDLRSKGLTPLHVAAMSLRFIFPLEVRGISSSRYQREGS